jgi:alpha-beta hydrolase superfamily lysophospholipase
MMVSPAQLSVLRMIPIAWRAARVGQRRLAVFRLINSSRGWDTRHTPVQDAHWALEQLAARYRKRLPTCLIGHSLGGRAALLAIDRREVRSAVALAPWVYPTDIPARPCADHVLIVHGSRDRTASPQRSAELAMRLSTKVWVGYVEVEGGKHGMLRRLRLFDGLAADFAAATLLGTSSNGTVARMQAGETWLRL